MRLSQTLMLANLRVEFVTYGVLVPVQKRSVIASPKPLQIREGLMVSRNLYHAMRHTINAASLHNASSDGSADALIQNHPFAV